MSALDEIRAEVVRNGSRCGTGPVIASLDESDRQAVFAAYAEGIQAGAIARWLAKKGIEITGPRLRYHLSGACQCPR